MSRSRRPAPPPKPPRPVEVPREVTSTGQRLPRLDTMPPIPDPEVEFRVPSFTRSEHPTGRRDENVSRLQQLIGCFDEMDDLNRELLVEIAHSVLTQQTKRG